MSRSSRTTLLGLPAELRLEIYDQTMALFNFNRPRYSIPEHPLLQTCKYIRNEAMGSYNRRLTQIVDDHSGFSLSAKIEFHSALLRLDRRSAEVQTLKRRQEEAERKFQVNEWLVAKKRRQLKEDGYELRD